MDIVLCGCGALGSWIGIMLAHPSDRYFLIDDDRVAECNLGTSFYPQIDVGQTKTRALGWRMYRRGVTHIQWSNNTLSTQSELTRVIDDFSSGDVLVIDTFDNVDARSITVEVGLRRKYDVVHIGLSEDMTGAVVWDDVYVLPPRNFGREDNPVCTNQLGVQIIQFTATVAANIIRRWIVSGHKRTVLTLQSGMVIGG